LGMLPVQPLEIVVLVLLVMDEVAC
jgi:hypothetical protein